VCAEKRENISYSVVKISVLKKDRKSSFSNETLLILIILSDSLFKIKRRLYYAIY